MKKKNHRFENIQRLYLKKKMYRESQFTMDPHPFSDLLAFANEKVKKGVGVHGKADLTNVVYS